MVDVKVLTLVQARRSRKPVTVIDAAGKYYIGTILASNWTKPLLDPILAEQIFKVVDVDGTTICAFRASSTVDGMILIYDKID